VTYFIIKTVQEKELRCLLIQVNDMKNNSTTQKLSIWVAEIFDTNRLYVMEFQCAAQAFENGLVQFAILDLLRSFQLWDPSITYDPSKFSSETFNHVDTFHGYSLKLPIEFKLTSKGAITTWEYSPLQIRLVVHVINLPYAIPPEAMYSGTSYYFRNDKNYVDLKDHTMNFNGLIYLGFTVVQANHKEGLNEPKTQDDNHSFILNLFGSGSMYSITLLTPFKNAEASTPIFYERVVKSFFVGY